MPWRTHRLPDPDVQEQRVHRHACPADAKAAQHTRIRCGSGRRDLRIRRPGRRICGDSGRSVAQLRRERRDPTQQWQDIPMELPGRQRRPTQDLAAARFGRQRRGLPTRAQRGVQHRPGRQRVRAQCHRPSQRDRRHHGRQGTDARTPDRCAAAVPNRRGGLRR